MGYTTGSNNGFVTRYERRIANFVCFFLLFFSFFSLLYTSTAARKNRLFTLISIFTTFVGAWARSKKQKQILPSLYDGNVLSRVLYGCFFFLPPSPFFLISLFFGYNQEHSMLVIFIRMMHRDSTFRWKIRNNKWKIICMCTIVWYET